MGLFLDSQFYSMDMYLSLCQYHTLDCCSFVASFEVETEEPNFVLLF